MKIPITVLIQYGGEEEGKEKGEGMRKERDGEWGVGGEGGQRQNLKRKIFRLLSSYYQIMLRK